MTQFLFLLSWLLLYFYFNDLLYVFDRPSFPLQGFVYTEIQFIEDKSYMVPTLKEK